MGQRNCHPQPGDLIAFSRLGYQHWALYVGDGYVVHVTDVASERVEGRSSSKFIRAQVKKELLEDVARKNKWRVNNKYDRSRTPLPVNEIIRLAEFFINFKVNYDVLSSNCEHFVTLLRYGEPISDQATIASGGITGAAQGIVDILLAVCTAAARGGSLPGAAVGGAADAVISIFSNVVVARLRSR